MAVKKESRWLRLFEEFIDDIRITSKEVVSADERGTKLELWESQRRFIKEVGEGLDQGVHKFNCLKGRQQGITTVSIALVDVFWPALHSNLTSCLVTDTEKNRDVNRMLIEKYVKSFEPGYFGDKFEIVRSNRQVIKFSNGSRIDLLVAGTKDKGISWGEGVGYTSGHLTEVSAYGNVEGLKSLEEGFAQGAPQRLFIYESTAKGWNHWRARWMQGETDFLNQRSFFLGWWAGDTNRIEKKDPNYAQFGYPAEPDEKDLMNQVYKLYGWRVTPEQLAWVRWKGTTAGNEQELLEQNQPWTATQAFVMTGSSFFGIEKINSELRNFELSTTIFTGYRYEVDGDFFNFKMFALHPKKDSIKDVELKVWEEPEEDGKYVIGMDTAYGRNDHKDANAISVWRCYADRLVQCAEYVNADVEPKHAAWVLFHLAAAYRDCVVNVEINGPGGMVMMEFDHLRQLLGAEMNQQRTDDKGWQDAASMARWYLYHRPDSMGAGYMANFQTNWSTQPTLMYGLRGCYVSKELVIRSKALIMEMRNVIVDDGHIGAPESSDATQKDDRVFAMALSVRAWVDWVRKGQIANGETYEKVTEEAQQNLKPVLKQVNAIVHNFLARVNEEPEAPGPPQWKIDQGLA